MKDRAFLAGAFAALFLTLFVGSFASRHERHQSRFGGASPRAPRIGRLTLPQDAESRAGHAWLSGAMLNHFALTRFFVRDVVPVYGIAVPGNEAVTIRDRLAAHPGGRIPVILGDGFAVESHARSVSSTTQSVASILESSARLDLNAWVANALTNRAVPEVHGAELVAGTERFEASLESESRAPASEVGIALLPTPNANHAPAWLAFGNWRRCPTPDVHVAMLTRWKEQFGAEVIAVDSERIELRIAHPPQGDALTRAAREMAAYAPESIRLYRSLEGIGAMMERSPVWRMTWPRRGRR